MEHELSILFALDTPQGKIDAILGEIGEASADPIDAEMSKSRERIRGVGNRLVKVARMVVRIDQEPFLKMMDELWEDYPEIVSTMHVPLGVDIIAGERRLPPMEAPPPAPPPQPSLTSTTAALLERYRSKKERRFTH